MTKWKPRRINKYKILETHKLDLNNDETFNTILMAQFN